MPSFALITEGITDQVVLEMILEGHYRDRSPVSVNLLQPLRDETDRSRVATGTFANWELVLEYCSNRDHIQAAFEYNDYLIIQIDSDCGDHPNFGVPLTEGGQGRPAPLLVAEVRAKLIGKLGADLYDTYRDRIFFAICVHSLECWLLPLWEDQDGKKRRTLNCADHLQNALSRRKERFVKDYRTYRGLAGEYRKSGAITAAVGFNDSLKMFVESLPVPA